MTRRADFALAAAVALAGCGVSARVERVSE